MNYLEKNFTPYGITGLIYRVNDLHSKITDLEGGKFNNDKDIDNLFAAVVFLGSFLKLKPVGFSGGDKEQYVIDALALMGAEVWPDLYMITSVDEETKLATVVLREREFDSAGMIVPSGTATSSFPTLALMQAFIRLLYASLVQQYLIYLSPGLSQSVNRQGKDIPYEDWARSGLQGHFEGITARHDRPASGGRFKVPKPTPKLPLEGGGYAFPNRPIVPTKSAIFDDRSLLPKKAPTIRFIGKDGSFLSDEQAAKLLAFIFGDKKRLH